MKRQRILIGLGIYALWVGGLLYCKSAVQNDGPWLGQLFQTADPSEAPLMQRSKSLRFFYVDQPPAAAWKARAYSAKWFTCLTAQAMPLHLNFRLFSDDGAKVFIDGALVGDNDGIHLIQERQFEVDLQPGRHLIEVHYHQAMGHAYLILDAALAPGAAYRPLPQALLSPPHPENGQMSCEIADAKLNG